MRTNRSAMPFACGGTKRRANDLRPRASKDLVKTVGGLLVSVANQEADGGLAIRQTPCHLSGLLCDHGAVAFAVQPADAHGDSQLDEEQHATCCRQIVSMLKKSTGHILCRCARINSRQVGPPRVPTGQDRIAEATCARWSPRQ